MNIKLSQTNKGIEWIKQFDVEDQENAASLIDQIKLVDNQKLLSELHSMIVSRADCIGGRVGLYAEREVELDGNKNPKGLFKQELKNDQLRAFGEGPSLTIPTIDGHIEVGSEGVIANLITQLCRISPEMFYNHPRPDLIRDKKIQSFFLITDFIGSGGHIRDYLSAVWRVASVKSWASLKLMKFEVIAYSAVEQGIASIRRHNCSPHVSINFTCPTIDAVFAQQDAEKIKDLCVKKDPIKKDPVKSLGYEGAGALIAFDHGCPNNVPRILYQSKKNKDWKPLFPKRVTLEVNSIFGVNNDRLNLSQRLSKMNEKRLAGGNWIEKTHEDNRALVLVLVALRKAPRLDEAISRKTGLTIPEIKIIIEVMTRWGWLNDKRYLTDEGNNQLKYMRNMKGEKEPMLSTGSGIPYYPHQLRAPNESSS